MGRTECKGSSKMVVAFRCSSYCPQCRKLRVALRSLKRTSYVSKQPLLDLCLFSLLALSTVGIHWKIVASPEKDCGVSPQGGQPQARVGQDEQQNPALIYREQIMPEQPDCVL